MLAANVPGRIALPFANAAGVGYKNAIPVASQIGVTPGAASYTDGFPPLCFLPLTAGGIAPAGADFNGLLNAITAVQQWQSAGGSFHYDSTFSTAIGGYPAGAMIISTTNTTTWLNLVDNNTTNPDATDGSAANWVPVDAYGIAAITGLTNASMTLLPSQWSKPVITLAGTLTANINIIFPAFAQEWLVVNNTTGAFSVTCKTSAGTGAVVAQGGGQQTFWGDGTNLNPLAGNSALPFVVGTATASTHAMNQAASDARYASISSLGGISPPYGLTMSTAGASTSMTIAAGRATDSTASVVMVLSSAITKTIAAWSVGTAAGGLDTGSISNSTGYHFYEIRRPDTGVVDVCFSLSATAPTFGSNINSAYTQFRRIGSGYLNSSGQWESFIQVGNVFRWKTPSLDAANVSLTSTYANLTLRVPTGVRVKAFGNSLAPTNNNVLQIRPTDCSDGTPSTTASPLSTNWVNAVASAMHWDCLTDTSGRVAWAGSTSSAGWYLTTEGYTDYL